MSWKTHDYDKWRNENQIIYRLFHSALNNCTYYCIKEEKIIIFYNHLRLLPFITCTTSPSMDVFFVVFFATLAQMTVVHIKHPSEYLWRRSEKQPWPLVGSCGAERPQAASCCFCSCSQTFPGRPARAVEKHITGRFQREIRCPLPIHKGMWVTHWNHKINRHSWKWMEKQ